MTRESDSESQRKGATLSDKTARKEFGLTRAEIGQAIRAGKLHYRDEVGTPSITTCELA